MGASISGRGRLRPHRRSESLRGHRQRQPASTVSTCTLKFVFRCFVSLALILFVLSKVDWTELRAVLVRLDWRWAVTGWALSFFIIGGLAVRWQILLRQQGLRFPLRTIFSLSWAGQFFNSILPGSTGGDLMRIYQVCRFAPAQKAAAVATIFMDRLSALIALLLLAAIGFALDPAVLGPILGERVSRQTLLWLLAGLTFAAIAAALLVITVFHDASWFGKLQRTLRAARTNIALGPQLLAVAALAFGIHVVNFSVVYLFARSLGITISYWQVLLMMPVILFLVMIPVTINGHGLRELLLIGYLSHFGVHLDRNSPAEIQEIAIALSLLLVTNDLLWSVPGGILYLVRFRRTAAELPSPAGAPAVQ